jgi:BlaI family penicillinase repressor
MTELPGISSAEWTVMQVLWRQSSFLSAIEVYEALEGSPDWHPKTVRTLLGRLLRKGAVSRRKRGGVYRFSALVQEEDCVREEGRSFLERCFAGDARPMLAHFIEHEDLTAQDIATLRAMLDKRAEQEKGHGKR